MSKSAFPFVVGEAATAQYVGDISEGMTLDEWRWTQFAAAVLQSWPTPNDAGDAYMQIGRKIANVIETADAMMVAIAEREQEK